MTDANIQELAEKTIEDFKGMADIAGKLAAIKVPVAAADGVFKKSWAALKAVIPLVVDVVGHVEKIGADLKLAGAQKRDLAVAIVNKLVDLPLLPEIAEEKLIGIAIDAIVAALNSPLAKKWGVA